MSSLDKPAIESDDVLRPDPLGDSALLDALPVGVYACDANGLLVRYNRTAAELWGRKPRLGEVNERFCGSVRLYDLNGDFLPHAACPLAVALTTGQACTDQFVEIERPDGSRLTALVNVEILTDADGAITGAINVFRQCPVRPIRSNNSEPTDLSSERLAAIVESSDDAILSKDLNGVIRSWNRGAERLFGYSEDEIIGRPVTLLIPADRQNEEPEILGRVRRGERIEHYETVRRRKDGSLVDISLSVSPIVDSHGNIVGASKIARNISERRRAEQQKDLLLSEMNHRVKNLFALASGMVNLSARGADSVKELAADLRAKFLALARAHSLTLAQNEQASTHQVTSLHGLIAELIRPYLDSDNGQRRVIISGPDLTLGQAALTNVALLLHEFATNALKYGALAAEAGQVHIACSFQGDNICIDWTETGVQPSEHAAQPEGFGSRLARATIKALDGSFSRHFIDGGLTIRLTAPKARFQQ